MRWSGAVRWLSRRLALPRFGIPRLAIRPLALPHWSVMRYDPSPLRPRGPWSRSIVTLDLICLVLIALLWLAARGLIALCQRV